MMRHPLSTRAILTGLLFLWTIYLWIGRGDSRFSYRTAIGEPCLRPEPLSTSKVATLGMFYGPVSTIYARIMDNQRAYSMRHGYRSIMLRDKIMPRLWSKPAFQLKTIVEELEKPVEERLEWLFWLDTDIIFMNPNIPLEVYLPPQNMRDEINIIVANDHNGLNVGAYFVRVNSWAIELFAETLALPGLRPDVYLKYSDQSAVEWLLKEDRYRNQTVYVPQVFFNAYIGDRGENAELQRQTRDGVREGDVLIHFAGKPERAKSRLELYMGIAESHDPKWEVPLEETNIRHELANFWIEELARRSEGNFAGKR